MNGAAQIEETATQLAGRLRNSISRQRIMPVFSRLSCCMDSSKSAALLCASMIHLFLKTARKFDEAANFVLVQLIEQEPDICNKRYQDYARRGKVDLAWEKISHKMKKAGMCVYTRVCIYIYIYVITKTYNRIKIQNMSAKTMQKKNYNMTRAL
jgi:hypothetical protein